MILIIKWNRWFLLSQWITELHEPWSSDYVEQEIWLLLPELSFACTVTTVGIESADWRQRVSQSMFISSHAHRILESSIGMSSLLFDNWLALSYSSTLVMVVLEWSKGEHHYHREFLKDNLHAVGIVILCVYSVAGLGDEEPLCGRHSINTVYTMAGPPITWSSIPLSALIHPSLVF